MIKRFATIAAVSAALATSLVLAREKWPEASPERKAQDAAARRDAEARWEKLKPEVEAWAAKGKPYLPWAGKPSDLPQAGIPAFPGAEGGGMYSFGGRGGKVYVVTSLDDSGPGTLRAAVETAGPRIVVFNVAGIIHLKSVLDIRAPYITIAGQTAPGDGICVAGQSTWIDAHDVVIRYMRFRRGETDVFARDDSLGGNPVGNVIIDHCSCSWGLDENISMYRHMYQPPDGTKELKLPTTNITIQWTISSEALNPYNHAFGGTWGGTNDTFHHDLFADNTGRNCSMGLGGDFNYINNVVFNWRHRTLDGGDASSRPNIINNYYKPGPATPKTAQIGYRIVKAESRSGKNVEPAYGKFYVTGNIVEGNAQVTADNWAGGVQLTDPAVPSEDAAPTAAGDAPGDAQPAADTQPPATRPSAIVQLAPALVKTMRADAPFPMTHVTIQPARDAFEAVLANAGATLPRRDSVDERVTTEVKTGITWGMGQHIPIQSMPGLTPNDIGTAGNGIITNVKQVGGYPDYKGTPVIYTQNDGIPDWWKKKYGLDMNDPDLATKDASGDGYTNIEKYLNGLDPTKKVDWKDLKNNVNQLGGGEVLRGS